MFRLMQLILWTSIYVLIERAWSAVTLILWTSIYYYIIILKDSHAIEPSSGLFQEELLIRIFLYFIHKYFILQYEIS
jgi:hypothetical protein